MDYKSALFLELAIKAGFETSTVSLRSSEEDRTGLPKAIPARLDADKTAKPSTKIVSHPEVGICIRPGTSLVNPEYVGSDGGVWTLHEDLTPEEWLARKVLKL